MQRRDLLRMAGVGLGAAVGSGIMGPGTAAAAPASGARAQGVDFWLRFTSAAALSPADPDLVTVEVEVGNAGVNDATAPVRVVLITPFFANFHAPAALPYFRRYIVNNPDPAIPEMVEFEIPANKLASHSGAHFEVLIDVLPDGPRIADMIYGCIASTSDTETTLLNNEALGTIGVPIKPLPTPPAGSNLTNFYFSSPQPRLSAGQSGRFQIHVGNAGNTLPMSNALFTFVSPYRVKVNRAAAPAGSVFLHNETDPAIPDIMTFPVSRLLLPPDPNLLTLVPALSLVNIPVTNYGDAHSSRSGKGYLAPRSPDFDTQPGIGMARMIMIEPV